MTCATCGELVEVVKSSGGTSEGSFTEKHECLNGHTGTVTGEASDWPSKWNRYGAVFNE